MTTRNVLLALIAAAALSLIGLYAAAGMIRPAVLALGLGSLWIGLEYRQPQTLASVLLVSLVALVAWAGLSGLSAPVLLFSLSTGLAAWDLSRFRLRVMEDSQDEIPPALEIAHLRKLAIIVSAGFLAALLPLLIRIPANFIVFALIFFVATVLLRRAVVQLRSDPPPKS